MPQRTRCDHTTACRQAQPASKAARQVIRRRPLAGLSKTGLGVVLPERALHLPAMESLAAPARLLPRTRPASADAVRRALLTAFWGATVHRRTMPSSSS